MSDVKRYTMVGPDWEAAPDATGKWVRASDFDAAQSELAALREELAKANKSADTYLAAWEKCAEFRDASEAKLAAAEQRNANLETDLKVTKQALQSLKGERADSDLRVMDLLARASQCGGLTEDWHEAVAALKPTESGASE